MQNIASTNKAKRNTKESNRKVSGPTEVIDHIKVDIDGK